MPFLHKITLKLTSNRLLQHKIKHLHSNLKVSFGLQLTPKNSQNLSSTNLKQLENEIDTWLEKSNIILLEKNCLAVAEYDVEEKFKIYEREVLSKLSANLVKNAAGQQNQSKDKKYQLRKKLLIKNFYANQQLSEAPSNGVINEPERTIPSDSYSYFEDSKTSTYISNQYTMTDISDFNESFKTEFILQQELEIDYLPFLKFECLDKNLESDEKFGILACGQENLRPGKAVIRVGRLSFVVRFAF